MTLPDLPIADDGYEYINALTEGWYPVGLWSTEGFNLGQWPLVVFAHYDSDNLYGLAVRIEGDFEIQEFATREERDKATSEKAVWYWRHYEVETAPQDMSDPRLGPYAY